MTNFPEYDLAREAGLCYIPTCFVTDFDCRDSERPHVTLEEVLNVMKGNNEKSVGPAPAFLTADPVTPKEPPCACKDGGPQDRLDDDSRSNSPRETTHF